MEETTKKSTSTRKVLIVEDDENTQALYKEAFEDIDFDVHILFGADGAFLEKVVQFQPDIISMDIMIGQESVEGGRNGLTALEMLKADERTRDIPVVMLSNFVEEGKVSEARTLGAVDYLVASGISPMEIAKRFLIYISDPDGYQPAHPTFSS